MNRHAMVLPSQSFRIFRRPVVNAVRRGVCSTRSAPLLPTLDWRRNIPGAFSCISSRALGTSKVAKTQSAEPYVGSYSTAFTLLEALWEGGVTNCFVNVGSDHPSIIEAIVKGKRERPGSWPRFITCPSEVTAISMADGYARVTGRPQAVFVHVDVGTQALAHGLHNASVGRAPVFIFAGLCPYDESGRLPGSRNEYQHWLQEAPDQKAIVRQYCRYVGEVHTGIQVKETVGRALQFASSSPKGPVYVVGAREVLAQEIEPCTLDQQQWVPVGPSALPADAVRIVSSALAQAERPLIITGHSGRDRRTPGILVALANLIPGMRVHNTSGSDVCFPFDHVASEGFRLGFDKCTEDADVIMVLDCDVPWIPSRNPPRKGTKIYHIGCDPLNQQIPVSFFPGNGRWKAESFTALSQLVDHIQSDAAIQEALRDPVHAARHDARIRSHHQRLDEIASRPSLGVQEPLTAHNIGHLLRTSLPDSTTFVLEAVTNAQALYDQIQQSRPGSWINCGATGIGWSNGAALGVQMALADMERELQQQRGGGSAAAKAKSPTLVCQIVGDGSFMCSAPSSALWVASKYKIPILTIVLNNGGWKSPRMSTELMYPNGLASSASDEEVSMSFRPAPNYSRLAEAASGSVAEPGETIDGDGLWMKGAQVRTVGDLKEALEEAKSRMLEDGKAMLVDALL